MIRRGTTRSMPVTLSSSAFSLKGGATGAPSSHPSAQPRASATTTEVGGGRRINTVGYHAPILCQRRTPGAPQASADRSATHQAVSAAISRRVGARASVAWFAAPEGKRMGHAGAIISGGKGTAAEKIAALQAAGSKVAPTPSEMGVTLQSML